MSGSRSNDNNHRDLFWVNLISVLIAFCFYALTAFRTITWWDNAEYSTAAAILGVAHPPGSLITTLLGWIVVHIPLGLTAIFKLNLLAGLVGSLTMAIIVGTAVRYRRFQDKNENSGLFIIGTAIGGLAFAFSVTVWSYATKLSPYIFTGFFTGMILWAFIRWSEESSLEKSYRWIFILTLLFGLDFSVHRTNMLLFPALIIGLLIVNWRIIKSYLSWIYGIIGLVIGLSFQLLIIPMAARRPFLNGADPSNLARFWDYISLKQYGGSWLINIFPRKASFWSYQIPDYLSTFGANFFNLDSAFGVWGIFPLIFGLFGLIFLWKSKKRLAIATLILFLFASIGAILYFNLPENYFRSNDRHYMPSFIIFAFWIVLGCGYFMQAIKQAYGRTRPVPIAAAVVLLWLMPLYQIGHNYHRMDCSRDYFTDNFGRNLLALPERAILFTNGDADTYTPWYYQVVEKLRPDVAVLNLSLLNTPQFVAQMISQNPDLLPSISSDEIANLNVRPWTDTTIYISAKCDRQDFDIPESVIMPDSIGFQIVPNIAGKYIRAQDWILLQIIIQNAWRRPIYFAITVSDDNRHWVNPYLRLEGLGQRLLPVKEPPINYDILEKNLVEKYKYDGYADPSVNIDMFTRMISFNYYPLFISLAEGQAGRGDYSGCQKTRDFVLKTLPIDRLGPMPASFTISLDSCCQNRVN